MNIAETGLDLVERGRVAALRKAHRGKEPLLDSRAAQLVNAFQLARALQQPSSPLTLNVIERGKAKKAAKARLVHVRAGSTKSKPKETKRTKSEQRGALFVQQASDMEFSALARMLRERLQPQSLKWEHVLLILAVLDRKAAGDETRVRIAKNLRQDWENVGNLSVVPRPVGVEILPWALLPQGKRGNQLQPLLAHVREFAKRNPGVAVDEDRIRHAYELRPKQVYIGQDHFDGYVVFLFPRTSKVLMEHPIEGNAAYVFSQNWKYLSTLTKTELIARNDSRRIIHNGEWKHALRTALGL